MIKISPERIQLAQNAAENPIWIETASDFARAAKAWKRCSELAIDTEFVRERTYYAKLGLVQISDTQSVWLLDVPALGNLDLLIEMLANPRITKIMHGAGEDLEIFWQQMQVMPEPLFDSQIAAAMLGYPLQLAYEHLITELLPITLEKGPSRSNWLQRPLTPEQILYAGNDVSYLPLAVEILQQRLRASNRLDWHAQEMRSVTAQVKRPADSDSLYLRVKGAGRLNGMGLASLQRLATWRDQQAQTRDLPRGFVLNDSELVEIAELVNNQHPINTDDIHSLKELHPKAKRRYAGLLIELLQQPPSEPLPELPGRPDAEQRKQLAEMQAVVRTTATELRLEPTLLASKRILQGLQTAANEQQQIPSLDGWRGELLDGKLGAVFNFN